MNTINDFTNKLHIKLYVADLLKDYAKDDSFNDMSERMISFIMKDMNLPNLPNKETSMQDIMGFWLKIISGTYQPKQTKDSCELENLYMDHKLKKVCDTCNRHGIIVGYSNEFNSLIAMCDKDSIKGFNIGENDFVDLPKDQRPNGFFYVSKDEIEKQCID